MTTNFELHVFGPMYSGKFEKEFTAKLARVLTNQETTTVWNNAANDVLRGFDKIVGGTVADLRGFLIFRLNDIPLESKDRPNGQSEAAWISKDAGINVVKFCDDIRNKQANMEAWRENSLYSKPAPKLPTAESSLDLTKANEDAMKLFAEYQKQLAEAAKKEAAKEKAAA